MKSKTVITIVAITLVVFSGLAAGMSYLVPVHPYEWSGEPELTAVPDSDAVLGILFLSGLGLPSALAALLILMRRLRGTFEIRERALLILSAVAFAACAYRFVSLLPLYAG